MKNIKNVIAPIVKGKVARIGRHSEECRMLTVVWVYALTYKKHKISFMKRRSNTMKKKIKTTVIIVTMGIMLVCAYLLGTTQTKTAETVPDNYVDTLSYDFYNNYVDMRQVTDFVSNDEGLQLYLSDGNSYYWER